MLYPNEISLILKKTQGEIKRVTELNRTVSAPIKKGDVLGQVFFKSGETVLASSPLIAESDVEEIKIKKGPFGFLK